MKKDKKKLNLMKYINDISTLYWINPCKDGCILWVRINLKEILINKLFNSDKKTLKERYYISWNLMPKIKIR